MGLDPGDPFRRPLQPGSPDLYAPLAGDALSNAETAAGNPPEGSQLYNLIRYPAEVWGGMGNLQSHTPPQWLVDLVTKYRAAPSDALWRHLVLREGVGAPYDVAERPTWLTEWLRQALGPEPGTVTPR